MGNTKWSNTIGRRLGARCATVWVNGIDPMTESAAVHSPITTLAALGALLKPAKPLSSGQSETSISARQVFAPHRGPIFWGISFLERE
jgi:hypothetical protein